MSETRLNINLSATNTASASIKELQAAVKGLENTLRELGNIAASASAAASASLQREIVAIREKIAALQQELAIKRASSAEGIRASQQEAEYINRNMDLIARKVQAEMRARNAAVRAEQQDLEKATALREAAARAEAAYINRNHDLAYNAMRKLADLENAAFARRLAMQAKSAAGIIAEASPSAAAAQAAAAASLRGAAPSVISAEATAAATAALERQQAAIRAVAAAMTAAKAAGASAQEIETAAINAATMALRVQARAAATAGEATTASSEASVLSMLAQPRMMRHYLAETDSLLRGQKGQALASFGAAARDAGLGVSGLTTAMVGLVAIVGVSSFLHAAESMGKWATETRAAASAAGMSIGAYSRLQGSLRLMGLNVNEADASLRHLAETLSTAMSSNTSLAAEAFHNLGISQKEVVATGGDVGKILELLAEAFVRNADGAAKSSNFNELLGRGWEKLIPLLQNGKKGLEEQGAAAAKLGYELSDKTAKGLEETGEAVRKLGAAIHGDGIRAMEDWGPVIRGLIAILQEAYSEIMLIVGALGQLASLIPGAISTLMHPFESYPDHVARIRKEIATRRGDVGQDQSEADRMRSRRVQTTPPPLTPAVTALETMREKMAEAQMQVAEGVVGKGAAVKKKMLEDEAKAEIKIMQETLANEQLTDKEKVALRTELANKITSLDNRMASGGGGRVSHQETTDYIADARLRIAEANGNSQKIAAIYDEEIAKLKQLVAAHKATMAQVSNAEREKVLAVNKARLDEIKEGARLEEQQQRLLKLNTSLAQMAAGTFKFAGQKEGPGAEQQRQQQYLAEAAQVHAMAQKEIADLQAIANAAGEGTTIQKEAQQEIMSVLLTSKQQEVELYKKAGDEAVAAANKLTATFTTMFDQIGTAFETFGKSLASAVLAPQQEIIKAGLGSKTISHQGDQIRAAIGQLLSSVAETIGKALMESIGKAIANSLSGGAANTIGELLSRWFTKGISGIFGGAAGEAGTKAVGSAAGGALSGAGGAGGAAALSTAGATLNTAGATLSTAGAALNTAAAALSTAGAAGGVAGGAGAAGGAAAAATAEATTISAAITAGDATIVSAIAASTTAIVSAVTAAGLNPSIAGFKFASGGIVPSAAGGMVGGMGGTLAILHAREMVLPAPISTGLQQMIARGNTGGGGGTSNTANLNFSPTVNTGPKGRGGTGMTRSEFSQMLSLHSGAMLGEARNLMRGGWRPS